MRQEAIERLMNLTDAELHELQVIYGHDVNCECFLCAKWMDQPIEDIPYTGVN
jgi:hypothetical protein